MTGRFNLADWTSIGVKLLSDDIADVMEAKQWIANTEVHMQRFLTFTDADWNEFDTKILQATIAAQQSTLICSLCGLSCDILTTSIESDVAMSKLLAFLTAVATMDDIALATKGAAAIVRVVAHIEAKGLSETPLSHLLERHLVIFANTDTRDKILRFFHENAVDCEENVAVVRMLGRVRVAGGETSLLLIVCQMIVDSFQQGDVLLLMNCVAVGGIVARVLGMKAEAFVSMKVMEVLDAILRSANSDPAGSSMAFPSVCRAVANMTWSHPSNTACAIELGWAALLGDIAVEVQHWTRVDESVWCAALEAVTSLSTTRVGCTFFDARLASETMVSLTSFVAQRGSVSARVAFIEWLAEYCRCVVAVQPAALVNENEARIAALFTSRVFQLLWGLRTHVEAEVRRALWKLMLECCTGGTVRNGTTPSALAIEVSGAVIPSCASFLAGSQCDEDVAVRGLQIQVADSCLRAVNTAELFHEALRKLIRRGLYPVAENRVAVGDRTA